MSVNLNEIITTLNLKPTRYSQLETILLEYGTLFQKLNNTEEQSWLFKKAEENNLLNLNKLKSQFEEIRATINTSTIDDLIEALNDENENILKLEKMERNTITSIGLAALNSRKAYIEELLSIKSSVDEINELDFYFENKGALIELLGW